MTNAFIEDVKESKVFAFDVEHDGNLKPHHANFEVDGVSFASTNHCYYERNRDRFSKIIKTLFAEDDIEAIAYNGKYDLKCLVEDNVITSYTYPAKFRDPMVMVNLLDENRTSGELGLKTVVWDQYGHQMMKYEEAASYGLESKEFAHYASEDAYWELKLFNELKHPLKEQGLWEVFSKILMRMSLVAADMECSGVGWNIEGAKGLLRGFQKFRKDTEEEIVRELGPMNLASGDQLAKRLFDELGYSTRGIEMTKSGKRFSTDGKAMGTLAKKYPICDKIVKYRTATKMISTYVEPLTRMALEDPNGRVHPTIWLVSTTGRTRMEKPNFQNIPAWLDKDFEKLNIRKNIVAAEGRKLIVADLSQIELRLCAHVTQDPEFLRAYRSWQCTSCGESGEHNIILHDCPKCGCPENDKILKDSSVKGFWHGLDLHQMTTDSVSALGGDRQAGKMCNFALIYYATAPRLHYEYPKFSIKEWDVVIAEYFEKYSGVRLWHKRMENLLHNKGEVSDVFGRKRRILKTAIRKSAKHSLNQFINFPIQSSACEYIELTMANLREECIKDGTWMKDIYQSNFVHDEGVWETPEELVSTFIPKIVKHMELSVEFSVPIRVDYTVVDTWGDAK